MPGFIRADCVRGEEKFGQQALSTELLNKNWHQTSGLVGWLVNPRKLYVGVLVNRNGQSKKRGACRISPISFFHRRNHIFCAFLEYLPPGGFCVYGRHPACVASRKTKTKFFYNVLISFSTVFLKHDTISKQQRKKATLPRFFGAVPRFFGSGYLLITRGVF